MALTDAAIRNAKPREKAYKLADAEGLHLHVTTAGSRVWRLKYRFQGREGLLTFGSYPEIKLADARDLRAEAKKLLKAGKNPAVEKKLAAIQAKVSQGNTFALVAEAYIAKREREGIAATTARKARWYLDLLSDVAERPIAEITRTELLAPLQRIDHSGRFETASNAREFASRVFGHAMILGYAERNVAADLKGALTAHKAKGHAAIIDKDGAGPKQPRERAIAVGRLMREIEAYGGRRETRAALLLMSHLFPRPGELRHAAWDEFDLEGAVWSIPAPRTKMRKPHVIPLSTQAVAILRDLFEASGGKGLVIRAARAGRPISENTLNVALRGLGYGKDEMTSHGFRALASTLLNDSGKWSADAVESALGHSAKGVRGTYHRGTAWEERVAMMQWWSDYLDAARGGGEVIELAEQPQRRAPTQAA